MTLDLWTVILTIVSFFLLYFLLNTFLFKPIIKFMDDRKARIEGGLEEGKKARQAKEENQRQLEEELRRTGGEAKQVLADAKSMDEADRAKALESARDDATAALKDARSRIGEEKKAAEASVSESMPELVAALTARLLGDDAVVSANAGLIRDCVLTAREQ